MAEYYPGVWERIMEYSESAHYKQELALHVSELLETNEDAVVVGPYHPMYELAIGSGYCNWGILNDWIFRESWVYPFPKGSPFVPIFSEM